MNAHTYVHTYACMYIHTYSFASSTPGWITWCKISIWMHIHMCIRTHAYTCIHTALLAPLLVELLGVKNLPIAWGLLCAAEVCMYVCMYVFMYVCMYVFMYVCIHVCMHACMSRLCLSLYIWVRCVYTHMFIHACNHVCMNIRMYSHFHNDCFFL